LGGASLGDGSHGENHWPPHSTGGSVGDPALKKGQAMKLDWKDCALLGISVALVLPLVFSWMSHLAPVLALFGVIIAAGVVIVRTSFALRESCLPEPQQSFVSVSTSSTQGVPRMNGMNGRSHLGGAAAAPLGIAGPASPPPQAGPLKWFGDVWNSKKHGLILLCAAAWIVCPIDGDFVPLLGWIDDGFAAVLGIKHFLDMFKTEVTGVHASMQGAIERAKQREALADDTVIDAGEGDVIEGEFTVVNDRRQRA
jgi:uncharacterized membrane protein YkvA (DUF1232 family)